MHQSTVSKIRKLQDNIKNSFVFAAFWSSILTILFVVLIYTADYPGIYHSHRISYISDNLAYKPAQSILLLCTTLPIWFLLSVCIIDQSAYRWIQFNLFALPISSGVGLVMFDLVRTKPMHYVFTAIFLISILLSHPVVVLTGTKHNIPPLHSWYWSVSLVTLISGMVFGVLALIGTTVQNNNVQSIAALLEWVAFIGVITLNMSVGTRATEHLKHKTSLKTTMINI
jgi:hypothetical protein